MLLIIKDDQVYDWTWIYLLIILYAFNFLNAFLYWVYQSISMLIIMKIALLKFYDDCNESFVKWKTQSY